MLLEGLQNEQLLYHIFWRPSALCREALPPSKTKLPVSLRQFCLCRWTRTATPPTSWTTCCQGWSSMPTTWRPWWRSAPTATWRRKRSSLNIEDNNNDGGVDEFQGHLIKKDFQIYWSKSRKNPIRIGQTWKDVIQVVVFCITTILNQVWRSSTWAPSILCGQVFTSSLNVKVLLIQKKEIRHQIIFSGTFLIKCNLRQNCSLCEVY